MNTYPTMPCCITHDCTNPVEHESDFLCEFCWQKFETARVAARLLGEEYVARPWRDDGWDRMGKRK